MLGKLLDTGGLLRVRSVLALGLTGIGGAFLLLNETMPPEAYNIIWVGAVTFYFSTRAAENSNGGA